MTWTLTAGAAIAVYLLWLWLAYRREHQPPEQREIQREINIAVIEANGHRQVFLWEDRHALAMEDAILKQQQDVPELWMRNEDFFRVTDAIRHSAEYRGRVR
jgi:hypothetical protein